MDSKVLKKWAWKMAGEQRLAIWKACLAIFGVSFCLIVSLMLFFYWLLSLKTSSLVGIIDFIAVAIILVAYLFVGGFSMQLYCYLRELIVNKQASLKLLKADLTTYFYHGIAFWLVMLACFLGLFLFIIPGVLIYLKFMPALYLLANHPEMSILTAFTTSCELMTAKRMIKRLTLKLSVLGWVILGVVTMFIGFFWIFPYLLMINNRFLLELDDHQSSTCKINDHQINDDIGEFAICNHLKHIDNYIFGLFNDYPVVIKVLNENISVTVSAVGNDRIKIDEYFSLLENKITCVKAINYSNGRIKVTLSGHDFNLVYQLLKNLTLTIRKIHYLPGCSHCHLQRETSFYRYHGKIINICHECYSQLRGNEDSFHEKYYYGFLGAMIGSLLGAVVWVVAYQYTVLGRLSGYLMAFLALKGYQIVSKRLSKTGLGICGFWSVIALILAEFFSLSFQIMQIASLSSLFEAIMITPGFIIHGNIAIIIIEDLVVGLAFIVLAFIQISYRLNHKDPNLEFISLEE